MAAWGLSLTMTSAKSIFKHCTSDPFTSSFPPLPSSPCPSPFPAPPPPPQNTATVECFCSDCTGGRTHCHGEMCISQVTLDHDTGEEIRRRRCLDDHLQICNRSSAIFSTLCCNTSDYCNLNFDAELAGEGEASGDSSSTTAGSAATTIPSQSPEPTTPSSATQGTAEPPSSPQPVSCEAHQ